MVLLVDGQMGLQAGDREILQWLRVHHPHKPVLLGVNKCENTMKSDLQVGGAWSYSVSGIKLNTDASCTLRTVCNCPHMHTCAQGRFLLIRSMHAHSSLTDKHSDLERVRLL